MSQNTIPLLERLERAAAAWASAHDASLAKLARTVVNDTGFFTRIAQRGTSVTTATLEKFAAFLADPANWPEGCVPQEAVDLAHVTGVSPAGPALSPGKSGDVSRQPASISAAVGEQRSAA